jgi:hypothetical protein
MRNLELQMPNPPKPEITNYKHQINAINFRLGLIHVGAAFQPRLNDYGYRATVISRLESRSHEELM